VGVLRPTRRVTDPKGDEWELYVLRYQQPSWQPGDPNSLTEDYAMEMRHPVGLVVFMIVDLISFLFHHVLVPLVRFLVTLPFAIVKGRRSRTVWIEAIMWDVSPHKKTALWMTTPAEAKSVLAQVTAGLAAGKFVHPAGGTFEGKRQV
jgi:hypothetical protein